MAAANLTIVIRARDDATATFTRVGEKTKALTTKLAAAGSRMSSVGKTLSRRITLPVVAAAGASVKLASDFEDSMSKIQGLVGVSQRQVSAWSDQILSMSRTLPQSPRELADAMFFVTSAGLRGAKAMDVLTMSARASAAGLGETQTVADAITSALNAYAGTGLKASGVTDALVAAVRAGKMPVDALAGSIGQVLGPAAELGIGFGEVAGTAAALSRVGVPVNRTMTGMRFLLTSLVNPTSQATAMLKRYGFTVEGLTRSMRERGLLATLADLHARMPTRDFLQVVGGARGVVTALGLVGRNGEQVAQVMHDVTNATGATDQAFKVASRTASFRFHAALSSLQATAIQVGGKLLPIVTRVVGWIARLADAFGRLNPGVRALVVGIALTAAAIGPALAAMGGLLTFGVKVLEMVRLLRAAFVALRAASLLAFVTNPAFLAGAAIVVVTVLIIKHWRRVQAILGAIWRGLVAVARAVWRALSKVLSFTPLLRLWKLEWRALTAVVGLAWDGLRALGRAGMTAIRTIVVPGVRAIAAVWGTVWRGMRTVFAAVWGGLAAVARPALNGIIALLNGVVHAINALIHGYNLIPGHRDVPTIPTIPSLARGGIATHATLAMIGEAGPEAVIPLHRLERIAGPTEVHVHLDRRRFVQAADYDVTYRGW